MTARATAAILGCAGPELSAAERAFFAATRPAGFILFARNVADPGQLRRLTGDLRAAAGHDAPILVDQEGGPVQRLRPPHWRAWPAAGDAVADLPPKAAARAMYRRYRLIAADLRDAGIDANCAPIADIATAATHEVLRRRCYGTAPGPVTAAARAVADALLAGGVLPVVKHVPGHGRARVDSHVAPPRVDADAETLAATDFAPFRALADLPAAMTAHVVYTALDPDHVATLSSTVVGLIRDRIGFDGLLVTDDISMGALSGPVGERAAAARRAGCDLVLHCNGDTAEMEAVAEAAGRLEDDGARRFDAALARRGAPDAADLARLGVATGAAHG